MISKIWYWNRQLVLAFVLAQGFSSTANGRPLTNTEVFYRCYGQITQQRVPRNHPLLPGVRGGGTDAITACMSVLNGALLTAASNTQVANTGDVESLSVLKTFNNLHRSWFKVADIYASAFFGPEYTPDYLDPSTGALYYTRALLHPSLSASSVVTGTTTLESVRAVQTPLRGPATNIEAANTAFGAGAIFAPMGQMFGVKPMGSRVLTALQGGPSHDVGQNSGGGAMGTQAYLMANVDAQVFDFRSDGAVKMPRKWAKSVFKDFLCRDLPVVRSEDSVSFVATMSPTPFRNVNSCTRCHVSMDRLSSNIRGFRHVGMYHGPFNAISSAIPVFARLETPTQPQETQWPSSPDPDYSRRPPTGTLYFRNYNGALVNEATNSLDDMGVKMSQQDDFYICWAKRYYEYFTGIGTETGDVADPSFGRTLTAQETTHRNRVITLGRSFRNHQNARQLIQEILSLPQYRTSNQGL
jgi:hypothetical protein